MAGNEDDCRGEINKQQECRDEREVIVRSMGFGRVLFEQRSAETGTCIILQKQLTGFFACLLFFSKVKHIS